MKTDFRSCIGLTVFFGGLLCISAVALYSENLWAQTVPSPSPKLHPRDLPAAGGGPYALMPNYAATASNGDKKLRHWRQPEVTFRVMPDKNDERTPEVQTALAMQGIALWKDKISTKLKLRLTNGPDEEADVEITFVSSDSLPPRYIGNTTIHAFDTPPRLDDLHDAQIEVLRNLPTDKLIQAVAHECGHALGIEGHSDSNGDLMFAYASHFPAEVTERDQNTFNYAY